MVSMEVRSERPMCLTGVLGLLSWRHCKPLLAWVMHTSPRLLLKQLGIASSPSVQDMDILSQSLKDVCLLHSGYHF
jgi:hypothetical protein